MLTHVLFASDAPDPEKDCFCKGKASIACEARGCPHCKRILVEGNLLKSETGEEISDSRLIKSARRMIK